MESSLDLEKERLQVLKDLAVLDTESEPEFDRLTEFACLSFDTPIALISFVDDTRQWNKSMAGMDQRCIDRNDSFCAQTVQHSEVLVVEQARQDSRFAHSSLVTDEPKVQFYAGAPLMSRSGHALGTFCVMDQQPRQFSEQQIKQLKKLAELVVSRLEEKKTRLRIANAIGLFKNANRAAPHGGCQL